MEFTTETEFTAEMYTRTLKAIEACNNVDALRSMLIEAVENADAEGSAGLAEYIARHWLKI